MALGTQWVFAEETGDFALLLGLQSFLEGLWLWPEESGNLALSLGLVLELAGLRAFVERRWLFRFCLLVAGLGVLLSVPGLAASMPCSWIVSPMFAGPGAELGSVTGSTISWDLAAETVSLSVGLATLRWSTLADELQVSVPG